MEYTIQIYKKQDIIDFIDNFKKQNKQVLEKVFTEGNCYYFAIILKNRFPEISIVYSQINNHFMCLYDNHIYDIFGDITNNVEVRDLYLWETYKNVDFIDYSNVVKYCINLER